MKSDTDDLLKDTSSQWNLIWWILGTIFIPITIPYTIFQILGNLLEKKNKSGLQGKVVVITGASSGLGEALCHTFYTAGCQVVLAARRKEELNRVRNDLMELHPTVPTYPPVIIQLDLSDLNSLPKKVDEILEIFGHIDILLNNGGISVRADALSTTIDVDIKVMLVNYFGAVAMTKSILPSMIKRKEGKIVFVSSIQGRVPIPYRSAYTASKHALQGFADSLRAEMDEHNISVTVVSPGYIKTQLSLNALTGTGTCYGVMDKTTSDGVSPQAIANDIFRAVLRNKTELIACGFQPTLALWMRFLFPNLYFWFMARRAKKLNLLGSSSE